MRSFFLQFFFSFWLVTIATFTAATIWGPYFVAGNQAQLRVSLDTTVQRMAQPALARYELQGCTGLSGLPKEIAFADQTGQPLCTGPFNSCLRKQIAQAASAHESMFRDARQAMIQVSPVQSKSGSRYFFIQRLPHVPRRWFPRLHPAALPVTILVLLLAAYVISRPVHALSSALRRFTEGDMHVRLPTPRRAQWATFGGADLRSLMVDFNHMADRICDLVEAQTLLIRDISHELRSPLARMQVALEIAREESPIPAEMLDQASNEVERLDALIGELLTLSLMESLRRAPAPNAFLFGEIFDTLIPDLKFEAGATGAQVIYQSSCDGVRLHGYPEMLRRAFENIVRNAIRYTPAGDAVRVAASVMQGSKAGEPAACVVRIEDRGPGVPEDHLKDILRPFYRVDTAEKTNAEGFGVGLAIAERAIHLHRGTISVRNGVSGGLVVEVTIPVTIPFTTPTAAG